MCGYQCYNICVRVRGQLRVRVHSKHPYLLSFFFKHSASKRVLAAEPASACFCPHAYTDWWKERHGDQKCGGHMSMEGGSETKLWLQWR